ncbi:DUF1566 domain-containing protein [bacterium]|nr:DUF1566 domain-containing protein [bacterium]
MMQSGHVRWTWHVLLAFVCWTAAANAQTPFYGKRYAVVVGINTYQHSHWPKLSYAQKDAAGFGELLEELGFTVYPLYDANASRAKIVSLLEDDLAPSLAANDAILFFFAGHGTTRRYNDEDYGYIVPYDATNKASTLISMEELRTLSAKMSRAKHQAFIMDCCYGGQLGVRGVKLSENIPNYLREVSTRVARQILTAGGKNQQVTDGGPGGHSIFTGYLLKGIQQGLADFNKDSWITFSELVAYITPAATSRLQTPGFATLPGHEQGEFLFPTLPPVIPSPGLRFRSAGATLSDDEVKRMLVANDFFDSSDNPRGKGIIHQFRSTTSKGQLLVIDDATGLTWQQGGSDDPMRFSAVQVYLDLLNRQEFAGYSDWRLPTLEEAMSLMAPENGLTGSYLNSVFDKRQEWIWTVDKDKLGEAWNVSFTDGTCHRYFTGVPCYVRAVRSGQS